MPAPSERGNAPIPLPTAAKPSKPPPRPDKPAKRFGFVIAAPIVAVALSALWLGAVGGHLIGYYGLDGLAGLDLREAAIFVIAGILPPILFLSVAYILVRGQMLAKAAQSLSETTEKLFSVDETVTHTAGRLAKAVRHEIDALNGGLDAAFARMRALENVLQNQKTSLDEAGARLDIRAQELASRIVQERDRLQALSESLTDTAASAGETVAGKAAQLKSTLEAAENTLKSAGNTLDVQAGEFRKAVSAAAEAPHATAVELDKQVKRIEQVADATMARAEFMLGRQERHRAGMTDMLHRIKEEGHDFEAALAAEREAMEKAIALIDAQSAKYENIAFETEKRLDAILAGAQNRAAQLSKDLSAEAERLQRLGETANQTLANLTRALNDAGVGAESLIGDTADKAKAEAKALVGAAMEERQKLDKGAAALAAQSDALRVSLTKSVEEVRKHLLALPDIAKEEAQKMRDLVRRETEEMLDLSARTLATMHERTAPKMPPPPAIGPADLEAEGMRAMARKLVQQKPKREEPKLDPKGKNWPISALLAAVDTKDPKDRRAADMADKQDAPAKPAPAAEIAALQAALDDMAVDFDAILPEGGMGAAEWKKYLSGDRGVFARRLAGAIDGETMHRIVSLYRDSAPFRDGADRYIENFETLLTNAKNSDPGGLLVTTVLTADTGKLYLALAYALGRF